MPYITETAPEDWKYVSEGGATIVFSYQGPPNPEFDGTVLRLRKSIVPSLEVRRAQEESADLGEGQTEADVPEEPDDPTIEYQTKCMERLIPAEHLPRLQTVRLDRSWLQSLAMLHDNRRPSERREKDEIDLNRQKGVLATDLVGGDWAAVEIKPKWGFLPSPEHLSEATKTVKGQTCRFCMHSYMRGKGTVTDYCPLDLYSGDEARVRKAIRSLWDGWVASDATLNNLKIFARGKFIKPTRANLLLAEGVDDQISMEEIQEAFAGALAQPLIQTPVLRILSRLQKDLDALDIEGLSRLWRKTETSAPLYRTTFASFFEQKTQDKPPTTPLGVSSLFLQSPEPGMSDWIEFLDAYLVEKPTLDHSHPSPEHLRYYLLAYLLSATFKDCSIIVRLGFLRPGDTTSREQVKAQSVTVIDLDPKSMDKLRGWEKLDKEIATTYSSVQRKVCIDAWRGDKLATN